VNCDTRKGWQLNLVKLSQLADTTEIDIQDVRGHTVMTIDGVKIGSVDDMLIDEVTRVVRFLEVGSGGFIGFGGHATLVPIEAVERIDESYVSVVSSQEHVAAAPIYNPHVVQSELFLSDIYEHYGYPPP
jgi:sporulation protein YlmC with PRC-barrel domain